MMAVLANIAGKTGKAIDLVGKYGGYVSPVIGAISSATPELNISEKLESYGGTYGGVQNTSANSPTQNGPGGSYPVKNNNQNTFGTGDGGNRGLASLNNNPFTNLQNNITRPNESVGGGAPSETNVIDSEFNAFNQYLNDQEGLSNQRFDATRGQIEGELNTGLQSLTSDQQYQQAQLDQKAESGRQNERLNLAKVNQLLQDLQQRDNARIAITGGGSTNEALSDRFARRAQSSVGDVVTEGQRFQNDVATESTRVEQFYATKKQELQNYARNAINEARLRLDDAIARIRNERNASANEKARAQIDAWKGYFNQVRNAQYEAANFDAQLSLWRQNANASIADKYVQNEIAGQDVSGTVNSLLNTQQPQIGGDQASALPDYANTRVNIGGRGTEDEEQDQLVV